MQQLETWNQEVSEALHRFGGNNLMDRVGKVAMAATLYCVWKRGISVFLLLSFVLKMLLLRVLKAM